MADQPEIPMDHPLEQSHPSDMFKYMPERPANQPQDAADRRRKGRVRSHHLTCQYGQITDMSASGLRIMRKKRPDLQDNQRITLTVRSEIDSFKLDAEIVRITQHDKKSWEIAVAIIDPSDEVREKLNLHARSAGMKGFAHLD